MKTENPFRRSLDEAGYFRGQWICVAQSTEFGVLARPTLVRGASRALLDIQRWVDEPPTAGPSFSPSDDRDKTEAQLNPVCELHGVTLEPFVAQFLPPHRPGWTEPVQSFLIYWQAWPEHSADGRIRWCRQDDDGGRDEIARWDPLVPEAKSREGKLLVRRDRLLAFLAMFDVDLAIYHQDLLSDVELSDGWDDSGITDNFVWETEAFDSPDDVIRARFFSVVLLKRPEYERTLQPWMSPDRSGFEYPIATDPVTGRLVKKRFEKEADYLRSVFFKPDVLEKYYNDPERYEVDIKRGSVGCKWQWNLFIARTKSGTIHAWLGDIALLPASVQQHWQAFATLDDGGPPEARVRRDLYNERVYEEDLSPIARLKAAIAIVNKAAIERFGYPLYASIDPTHEQSIKVLRVPANNSMRAFQEQILALAVLTVDHINATMLDKTKITGPESEGPLNRMARVYAGLSETSFESAKEALGGLFAIQSLRSTVAAHRTGIKGTAALTRAEIESTDRRSGFVRLVVRATAGLESFAQVLNSNAGSHV